MPRTSNKAELIMDYVNQFIQENGYSPSVREIGAAVGLRSTASVSYHLQALQDKGLLQSPGAKGRKRALVTGARPGQIPVIGVVTAGIPILAVENQEGTMPWGEPGCFALRVRGDSMINAGILDGDKVVVMIHYPPFNSKLEDSEFTGLFEKYGVDKVVYGHLHSYDKKGKLYLNKNGIDYYLTSCDLTENTLIEIL